MAGVWPASDGKLTGQRGHSQATTDIIRSTFFHFLDAEGRRTVYNSFSTSLLPQKFKILCSSEIWSSITEFILLSSIIIFLVWKLSDLSSQVLALGLMNKEKTKYDVPAQNRKIILTRTRLQKRNYFMTHYIAKSTSLFIIMYIHFYQPHSALI